jgi:hypothetical protein
VGREQGKYIRGKCWCSEGWEERRGGEERGKRAEWKAWVAWKGVGRAEGERGVGGGEGKFELRKEVF